MVTSVQALQDENLRLKSQLHLYEQYQVLLRIQRNLAMSLGTSVSMTQAFTLILDTVSKIQGVQGGGIIVRNEVTGNFILCAHSGKFKDIHGQVSVLDPRDRDTEYILKKGIVPCKEIPFLHAICRDSDNPVNLGIYPVGNKKDTHAVLLVLFDEEFGKLPLGKDLLDAIADQIGDVLRRVENEEMVRNSLEEKEILLKEVHHRVKNNLAMISSFISLQTTCVSDDSALSVLQSLQQKILSVAGIYELLYKSTNLTSIDFDVYVLQLVEEMIHTLAEDERRITLEAECDSVVIDIDTAITLGLIIAELVTNSFKYAFENGRGLLGLRVYELEHEIRIVFWDNGKGFPEGFSLEESEGLGERLILELTKQLKGSVSFIAGESKFSFRFPKGV